MNKFILFIVIFFSTINSKGQNWSCLGSGVDGSVRFMTIDSINNLLLVTGNFENANSINVNQIASWNGMAWDSLGQGMISGGSAYDITTFNHDIYASGNVLNDLNHFLGRWDGFSWDTIGLGINGAIGAFKELNGNLFIGGDFFNVNGQPAKFFAKYHPSGWSTFPTSTWNGGGVFAIEVYNNEIFCAGNFYDTISGINRICKWDGNSFVSIGNGITGSFSSVTAMIVYKNELYIGGYFTTNMGNVSNYIEKWNGNNFIPVGSGTNGTVRCMAIYNDELYIGGDFTTAGGIMANRLAKWDGAQWHAVTLSIIDGSIFDLIFFNNQLYIAGSFHNIDTFQIGYIAKYTGLLSIEGKDAFTPINFFINPTNNSLFVNSNVKLSSVRIYNKMGILVYSQLKIATEFNINISQLISDLYFLVIESEKGNIIKKFIKE